MVFYSENFNFAKILEENNIKFIGPSSKLIKMMGDKIQAKKLQKKMVCLLLKDQMEVYQT